DSEWVRPQWLLMLVIYFQLVYPRNFNPFFAWGIGLLLDSLYGNPLGEYALVFALISYLTALLRTRFITRPFWQQIGKIFLLVCLGQIMILWFHVFAGQNPHTLWYWVGTITSCLVWPLFYAVLHCIAKFLNVAPYPSRTHYV